MGKSHYELVPGQDCPETASYFNMWHLWNSGSPENNKRSICAFEWDMGKRRFRNAHTRTHTQYTMQLSRSRWGARPTGLYSSAEGSRTVCCCYSHRPRREGVSGEPTGPCGLNIQES